MSSSVFPGAGAGDIIHSDCLTGFFDDILFDFPLQDPVFNSPSGSDNSNRKTNSSNSGDVFPVDEQRQRRKMLNRESARRSRIRKQKHLENLRNQVNRYTSGNRELVNRLRFVNQNGQLVRRENEWLRSESVILEQRLRDIRQVLAVPELHRRLPASAWPCNNNVTYSINEQNPLSLITF